MKIILVKDYEPLGFQGDVVEVKRGYARNFLIPQGYALPATPGNLKQVEQKKKVWEAQAIKEKEQAERLKAIIEEMLLALTAKVGEEDLLFGSITSQDIADALEEKDIKIDRRKIMLHEPIKRAGEHKVQVRLHRDVIATLTVQVKGEESAGD